MTAYHTGMMMFRFFEICDNRIIGRIFKCFVFRIGFVFCTGNMMKMRCRMNKVQHLHPCENSKEKECDMPGFTVHKCCFSKKTLTKVTIIF